MTPSWTLVLPGAQLRRPADGAVLVREAGSGSGWISLPVTFRPR